MRFVVVVATVMVLIASSCAGDTTDPIAETPTTAADTPTSAPTPEFALASPSSTAAAAEEGGVAAAAIEPRWVAGESAYLFDQETLHTFEITIDEASLAELDADPAAEEYVEASLQFEGEDVGAVGLRYKGSIGAFVGCLSDPDPFQPSGAKTCTKLSMKVKINWEGRDERFYGVRKLQFHSMNLDPSQMHERLGYWLFAEMGVEAPRSVHARVVINGEFVGLFALTEQIDGRFSRDHFENGKGNVYKEVWPLNPSGQPHAESIYLDALETNEDENPSATIIRGLAEDVASAQNQDGVRAAIERWMNVEEALSYAVVDRAIRHDDGPFHWYCFGPQCAPHNFYWYEDPVENTLHLIPWDLDNAFENLTGQANPVTPVSDGWGETSADCEPYTAPGTFVPQRSAACDPLVSGWVSYEAEYERLLAEFLAGPGSVASVTEMIERWGTQITDATAEAAAVHSDAVSVDEWEAAMAKLLADFTAANHP